MGHQRCLVTWLWISARLSISLWSRSSRNAAAKIRPAMSVMNVCSRGCLADRLAGPFVFGGLVEADGWSSRRGLTPERSEGLTGREVSTHTSTGPKGRQRHIQKPLAALGMCGQLAGRVVDLAGG